MKSIPYAELSKLADNDSTNDLKGNIEQRFKVIHDKIQSIRDNFMGKKLLLWCSLLFAMIIEGERSIDVITNHKRGTKYCACEKYAILKLYLMQRKSKSKISDQLMIPFSSVAKLLKDWNINKLEDVTRRLPNEWYHRYIDPIIDFIGIYIKSEKSGFDVKELQTRIEQELNLKVKYSLIRDLLKNHFKLSFKKGASRPQNIDTMKQSIIRRLFCKEFINMINTNTKFINIDEVSISHKTKYNYSWLSRGFG